jgi:outer membrane protein OmpA-like peptidoglycan-associated protein
MKKFLALLWVMSAFVTHGFGQDDEVRPAAIGISFSLTDFATADRIRTTSLSSVFANKRWAKTSEMSPGLILHYFKGLKKHIDFAGNLGMTFTKYPFPNRPAFSDDRFLLSFDAAANFKLVSEKYWVTPYLIAGVGAHMYSAKYFGAYIPTGLGIKVNFFDEAHLFITSQYRVPVTNETANYHFLHSIGIAGRVGKPKQPKVIPPPPVVDTDKDGVIDPEDKCPTVPGLAKYQGCPVPDTDKDGLNDEEDKCPTVAGVARYQGCPIPDTDKDGINDEEDKCPTVAGLARYQGCPAADRDNDGVTDEEDKCPDTPGTKENQGCPEIKEEVIKKVDYAANNIYFATGKYVLLGKSFKGLNEVANVLKENPQLRLSIDGHTDNVGSDASNMKLSENRANAVKNYLVKQGVDAGRLIATGYGETQPVADNKTAAGRQQNRRVEMKLSY